MAFRILLAACIALSGCDSGRQPAVETTQTKGDCEFEPLTKLVGRNERVLSQCFDVRSEALIGRERNFPITVLSKNDQLILVLSGKDKEGEFVIRDVMLLPRISPNETVLYSSCYTNMESSVVDAVAIADYAEQQRFLLPKQSWLIDFGAGKILPNTHTKITCVNLGYGV